MTPKATEAVELFATGTVTIAGLKTEFGIGRTTAYELMNAGRLPYTQLGTRRLIPRAAVAKLLAEGLHGVVAGGHVSKKGD